MQMTSPASLPVTTDYWLTYDGSFDGFLTVIFRIYADRLTVAGISPQDIVQTDLLACTLFVENNATQAERVLNRLHDILGKTGIRQLLAGFLNETPMREMVLYGVIRQVLQQPDPDALQNVAHPDILTLTHWVRQLRIEQHRMEAFVRFELMDNGIFLSRIEPDLNVLPLVAPHFRRRFADQHWLIFDVRRDFGVYYDLDTLHQVSELDAALLKNPSHQFDVKELNYQKMWQTYFKHVNIPERRNLKRHVRELPRRYWKYLTEKQLSV